MAISVQAAKEFVDACRTARKIFDDMPELPSGLTPQSVHLVDAIHDLSVQQRSVRIGDLARAFGTAVSGITRQVNVLERLGYVEKRADESDGRAVNVALTARGRDLYERYVRSHFDGIVAALDGFSDEEIVTAAKTIERIDAALDARRAARKEGR